MRLKKLEIQGFKSFADKTKLEFHPGITAVVGPNGCGKSNIADAFRWVMGEQSAKSLRGHKMNDIVFAGTTTRKPLNFAEVTITLTDIEGMLPVVFDEIAITRRLHRSGESDYFINRHPVRLKDVQSLLLDTGMGKDAYSIFEQGKIDQVINLTPLDRRYIFEEAAGILRFLQRKKEALRKLEQTDLNVARVKDIHQEVEKQIIVLEQQAEKARLYKENKQVLEELEKFLLVTKWNNFQEKLKEAKLKSTDQEEKITGANGQIEALQSQLAESKLMVVELEKALRVRGEEVFKVRSDKEIKSKEKQGAIERLKDLQLKEKRWENELESMAEKRAYREQERKTLQNSQKELEKQCQKLEALVHSKREIATVSESELLKLREQQQTKQKELFKVAQRESQCESEIRQIVIRLENAQEKQGHMQGRKERSLVLEKDLLQQVDDKKNHLEEAVKAVDQQKDIFAAMEKDLQAIAEEVENAQFEIDRVYKELSEGKARQKALERLREDQEGFSIGSKQLLMESKNEKSVFYGKLKGLYEYFSSEKGAELALAAVMRSYSQTLVVQTKNDFELIVDYIKKNKIKDVSLLCVEALMTMKLSKQEILPSGLTPLAIKVLENEISRHFINDIYLSKDSKSPLITAENSQGIEVWFSDGSFLDRRSVVFYGTQGENNVFLREAELKALNKKLIETENVKVQWDNVLRVIQQKRHQLQNERAELDKTIRRAEMKLVELTFAQQKIGLDLDKTRAEIKTMTVDLKELSLAIQELSNQLAELREIHFEAKEVATKALKQNEKFVEELNNLSTTSRVQLNDLRETELLQQKTVDESRKTNHAIHVLEIKDAESLQQERRLQEEIELGRMAQSEFQQKGLEVEKLLHEVEHTLSDVVSACAELEQQLLTRKNALEFIETKINDKRNLLKKQEIERHQTGIHIVQFESNAQSLEDDLQERYRLTIAQALEKSEKNQRSFESLEKEIRQLRHQVEQAGDINMTSIEECDKHKTRYQFLNQQIDDLNVSKQELVEIITQLDGESRKIFKETFDQICINFKKNFQVLFNGGEADLQFTETGDVLEAGIEIIAKPPGKQMRSINLLSGGEKCLTAMALLFAIFEVKPAPFCILDEIDAPLDDTNVERFVNIVKLFVDRCQFIIITHNKRTMAIADIIVGVSMEEKGVSKLLSMDFSKEVLVDAIEA